MGRWGPQIFNANIGFQTPHDFPLIATLSHCPFCPAGYGSPPARDSRLCFLHAGQRVGLAAGAVMRYFPTFAQACKIM